MEAGQEVSTHRGDESRPYEELLQEASGVVAGVVRKRGSGCTSRAVLVHRGLEGIGDGGEYVARPFPWCIRAVMKEGLILKVLLFVLARSLNLVAEKKIL